MTPLRMVLVVLAVTSPRAATGTRSRIGRVLQLMIGAAPGLAMVLAWNYLRTGGALHAPYPAQNTDIDWRHLPLGLAGSLISPANAGGSW